MLDFIKEHRNDDVRRLALEAGRYKHIDMPYALEQIAGWQKARTKLASWATKDGIIFPPHISMEQCSSEQTATYKASILAQYINKEKAGIIDFTGGFGVDFSYMAQGFQRCVYVERQSHLCSIAAKNMPLLGLPHAEILNEESEDLIASGKWHTEGMEWAVFLDPARRDTHGGRTYAITDCTPNIIGFIGNLLQKATVVMVKLSPMLDWHATVNDLNAAVKEYNASMEAHDAVREVHDAVREVHIVATGNECKELLIVLSTRSESALKVFCVNDNQQFVYTPLNDNVRPLRGRFEGFDIMKPQVSDPRLPMYAPPGGSPDERSQRDDAENRQDDKRPQRGRDLGNCGSKTCRQAYENIKDVPEGVALHPAAHIGCSLYVPNAAIMKAGCFAELEREFSIQQIAPNSHLFVSSEEVAGFPGKQYTISAVSSMNKKDLKAVLHDIERVNIATRNFPMKPEELRKRLKLKDGGSDFIFATTTNKGNHIIILATPTIV